MAILSVDHVWSEESWTDEKGGGREYEDMYRVISDDPNESAVAVRASAGIPQIGDFYLDDPAARCSKRSASRTRESREVWEVRVTHSYAPGEDEEEDDPLAEPAKIRWNSVAVAKPVVKDLNGNAVVNSAGDYFDPPPEVEEPRWMANIQFNVAAVPVAIASYRGAVNAAPISIGGYPVAAERARVVGLDISERQVRNDIAFYTVTLAVDVQDADDDGFDLSLLDQGLRQYIPSPGNGLVECKSWDDEAEEYVRVSSPALLNGSGLQQTEPTPESAIFLNFEVTRKLPLNVFPGIT